MPYVLAIDQSTSATKALLFDTAGALIDKSSFDHKQIYPKPGWVEHDAGEIWRNTLAVIKSLLGHHPQKARELLCLSITNQRETIVIFDRATGAPLHNAIVWQCCRGGEICAELSAHNDFVTRTTGLKIDTYFSASKLTWLIRNHPEIAERLANGEALIGTIDTYLIYRLTGGKVFATDHTNASRTLLYDIEKLRWSEKLCEIFSVPMPALPEIRDCSANFGETNLGGLLSREIPICGVMGDSQAALFAQQCFTPGAAKVTIGTGSSVLLNIGRDCRIAPEAGCTAIAWVLSGIPTYCFEGIISHSAATIAWLKDQLQLIASADETESAAMSVQDSAGVYFVPAFSGLSAPHWSPNARAAIVGLTAHSTRNHVVRAALESIAYQIRDVLHAMRLRSGVDLKAIHADGGATKNKFLCQFIADITGTALHVSTIPDCSPLGAAMAGLLGMEIAGSVDDLKRVPRAATIYTPALPRDRAALLIEGWQRAVRQVLAGMD
jgi:glycerol kinase